MSDNAAVNQKLVAHLKKLVKDLPVEVLGHVEARTLCCGSGTVALVRIEDRGDPAPVTKTAGKTAKK
jgi:hypothetical protein